MTPEEKVAMLIRCIELGIISPETAKRILGTPLPEKLEMETVENDTFRITEVAGIVDDCTRGL